jgi:hypothetical protein
MHGIDVGFGEDRGGSGNDRWDEDLTSLAQLADMTSFSIPVNVADHTGCKGTSVRFLTFPLLSSIILHSPLLSHTHSCLYVLSPTLCTIPRYQTLEVDDSRAYYRRQHSTPPSALTSEASDKLRTHWDRSARHYGTLRHHVDAHIGEAWY